MTEILDFGDEFRLLLRDVNECVVDFEIYEIVHMTLKEDGEWGHPCFETYDCHGSGDETEDMGLACPTIRGSVKFDGCSHVYFGNAPAKDKPHDGYLHLCGHHSWDKHCKMMQTAFDECRKRLKKRGHWCDD